MLVFWVVTVLFRDLSESRRRYLAAALGKAGCSSGCSQPFAEAMITPKPLAKDTGARPSLSKGGWPLPGLFHLGPSTPVECVVLGRDTEEC